MAISYLPLSHLPDFALVLPNTSYVSDLGALLPAVGAAGEAAQAASSGRMSGAGGSGRAVRKRNELWKV